MAAITDLATLAAADVAAADWLVINDSGTDKKVAISSLFYNATGRNIAPTFQSVANNGTITLTGLNYGLLMVQNDTDGGQALFWLSGSVTSIINQVGSSFTVTSGTANEINVYISGGNAVIENKLGATKQISYLGFAL